MEKAVYPLLFLANRWHHRHTKKFAQQMMVEFVAACFQFIIHIKRNDHAHIHINELCGKVEVSL